LELIARLGDRVERVSIERQGARYRIVVGDRTHDVDVRSVGPVLRSLVVDGESHETTVLRDGTDAWRIGWRGRSARVELVDPLTHLAEEAHADSGKHQRKVVVAMMPGRVVSVAVEEGAEVQPGAPLVVLEAMKMQNELQAEHAGRVRKVHVTAGQAVEGGDPLVEIE